jgi:hypothetical protein
MKRRERSIEINKDVACGPLAHRWSPRLPPDFDRQDSIDIGLVEEVAIDREMLAAMRTERSDAALAPRGDVDHEVGAGLFLEAIREGGIPGRDGGRPQQAPDGMGRPGVPVPSRIGGRGNGVAREAADRHVIAMHVESVGIERDHDRRLGVSDVRDELATYLIWRGVSQVTIGVVEQVQLVEPDDRGGIAQFSGTAGGKITRIANGRIAYLAALAERCRHQDAARARGRALHHGSRAGEALVVGMRKDEEKSRSLGMCVHVIEPC